MKYNCKKLNDEFLFFQNLLLDILTRQVVLKKFEEKIKGTKLTVDNYFIRIIWYGYVISQLSDCRKFFDKDSRVHSFQFIVAHVIDKTVKEKNITIFKYWHNKKLESLSNQYLLHANKKASSLEINISVNILDEFIVQLKDYIEEIFKDLNKNYSGFGDLIIDGYLEDAKNEVEIFFQQVRN